MVADYFSRPGISSGKPAACQADNMADWPGNERQSAKILSKKQEDSGGCLG
jgi:hypothetical protein